MRAGLWRRGPLTDVAVVSLAVAVLVGALRPAPVPVLPAIVGMVAAARWRRALPLLLSAALLAAGLSHQAWSGLSPLPPGPFQGGATLVGDPTPTFGGWQVDVRTSLGRVELVATGGAGGRLSSRQAGDRVEITGRVERLHDAAWAVPRHVRARVVADRVVPANRGGPSAAVSAVVNGVRDVVVRGARSLPGDQRALFLGFVLGDDRGASVVVADDFEGAGLSHLLVVSGQNVAFVLTVAAPLLARLGLRARLLATIGVIVLFASVTRFEPSVLRASTMAAVGATAVALGRPVSGLRVLALAVTGLLLVDPLLVHSMGFRLSTAASLGLVVLARPLADALPGPSWLTLPTAVTLAAQAAVAPLLVPAFGPMPVAAVPANLLAEPVAGLVMMWGCTAGLVAGLVPAPIAVLLQLPTRIGLWWVAGVARVAADLPLGFVGLGAIVATGALLTAAVVVRRQRWLRVALVVAGATVLVGAGLGATAPHVGRAELGGAELWRGAGPGAATVLVLPGNARVGDVLAGLRERDVDRVDLVVLRSSGPGAAGLLALLRQRVGVAAVWAPRGSPAADVLPPPDGPVVGGGLRVSARPEMERLVVEVELVDHPGPTATGAVGPGG